MACPTTTLLSWGRTEVIAQIKRRGTLGTKGGLESSKGYDQVPTCHLPAWASVSAFYPLQGLYEAQHNF